MLGNMQTWKSDVLYKAGFKLGEGLCWNPEEQNYLFVDIKGKLMGTVDSVTVEVKIRQLDKMIGKAVPVQNGNLLLAMEDGLEEMDPQTGSKKILVAVEPEKPDNRCNDGACDARGRFWFGTMNKNAKAKEGALYCFDGTLRKMIEGTSVSNGICWSTDHTKMYYIDSFDRNIKGFDFDLDSGQITNEEVIVELNHPMELPDGMCIDEEGMLWVAIWGGACVNRYNPHDGKLIGKVSVAALNVTSCAFGGKDGRELLISTAADGLTAEELEKFPDSGSLFIVQPGIGGFSGNTFKNL
ncbi:SMP-30/gluconolactonase/LRE family protein [Pedobacter nyackensis]|uniref:SMP-30/gluconolactonase/LRE family protein n=1 Tax=Pedobacter nyackensis TaxID=475255 RepID=UPI0029302518|nr:SMP-30/gluconolactonase/LRE family protein [Pedobacter nyackensis]